MENQEQLYLDYVRAKNRKDYKQAIQSLDMAMNGCYLESRINELGVLRAEMEAKLSPAPWWAKLLGVAR